MIDFCYPEDDQIVGDSFRSRSTQTFTNRISDVSYVELTSVFDISALGRVLPNRHIPKIGCFL